MTRATTATVVHVAGPRELGGLRQTCSRCGYVLHDYSGSQLAVPEGHDPTPSGWQEGGRVAVCGDTNRVMYLIEGRYLDTDEIECRPAS